VSSDPLDRIETALAPARTERDTLKHAAEQARLEIHQLQRRLTASEDQNRALLGRIADTESRLEAAEEQVAAHKRAIREHSGRTKAVK
jgi:septal ring factor EnvC (AmiA/AmiB activator)